VLSAGTFDSRAPGVAVARISRERAAFSETALVVARREDDNDRARFTVLWYIALYVIKKGHRHHGVRSHGGKTMTSAGKALDIDVYYT
jgi:hypothetical protein